LLNDIGTHAQIREEVMRSFVWISLIALLGCIPAHAIADSAAPARQETIFPPDAATCVLGKPNLLAWDGMHSVYCVPIPVCHGPTQILSFDGHTFTCIS
jgi:hypothetical protein